MKLASIRRVADLPSAFDLTKYEPVKNFGINDWLINLERRVFCRFELMKSEIWLSRGEARSRQHLETPILKPSDYSYCANQTGVKRIVFSNHVSDYQVLAHFCAVFDSKNPSYSKYWEAMERSETVKGSQEGDDKLLWSPLWEMYESAGINYQNNLPITVDIYGTEEKIVDDFRKWLKSTQTRLGISLPTRRITKKDFEQWEAFKVLPFLDLENWSRACNKEIALQVMGLALFPNDFNVGLADRIRKTVQPLVRSIAHEAFTDTLRSQTLEEHAEQKNDEYVPGKWDGI